MLKQAKLLRLADALDSVMGLIQNTAGYPEELAREVNDYRLLERETNELARASGMSDSSYREIVGRLLSKAAGTEVAVLQMLKDVFLALGNTVNFQDPVNINAIFGGMDRVNENKGPKGLVSWVKEQIIPLLQKSKEMGINPKQITSFINNNVNSFIGANENIEYVDAQTGQIVPYISLGQTEDGKVINKDTGQEVITRQTSVDVGKNQDDLMNIGQSALTKNSQSWEDVTGLKGDALKNSMDFTQAVRNTVTPISMRPDDQQATQALMAREFSALDQERLRVLLGLEKGMSPWTMIGIEDARKLLEEAAQKAPGVANATGIVPQVSTFVKQPLSLVPDLLDPGKMLSPQPLQKAASTKKLIKIAQIPPPMTGSSYTYVNDPNNPVPYDEFTPQPISGQSAWQQDVAQADITTDAASQARELELASMTAEQLFGYSMQIEKNAEMLSQHISQLQSGLERVNSLERQGIADETIVEQMKPMIEELMGIYNNLLGSYGITNRGQSQKGIYEFANEKIEAKLQTALRGDRSLTPGIIAKLQGFKQELAAKIQDAVYKQKNLIMQSATIEDRMKQKLQESIVTDTLKEQSQLYEDAFGSTLGRGQQAASEGQEAKYFMDAADKAGALNNGTSAAMQARLRQKGLSKMRDAVNSLNATTKPVIQTDESLQMAGG